MVGAAIGFPLELVLLDFSKTSYSSARAALLQSYRMFCGHQAVVQKRIIGPIYRRKVRKDLAGGRLRMPASKFDPYRLAYYPPRWAWIDPLREVMALEKEVQSGAMTIDDWTAQRGRVLESVAETRAWELGMFRDKKIPTTTAPDNLKIQTDGKQAND